MKKFILLLVASVSFAAPVGNPVSPQLIEKGVFTSCDRWVDFRIGFEGDFVTDGRLDQHDEGRGRVDRFRQYTNSGTLTLTLVNRMDIYGVWGGSKVKADWRFSEGDSIHIAKLKTYDQNLWAVGARTILYEWCRLFLGLGGRYSYSRYKPAHVSIDGLRVPVTDTHFFWKEWQVNMDFSYKICYFTPYIGVKYSNTQIHLGDFSVPIASNGTGNNEFINREPVGLYLGCGVTNGKYFMVNVEGRLIDEEAVTVSADLKF